MMPYCPDCRRHFSTPPGEEQDHDCPRCSLYGRPITVRDALGMADAIMRRAEEGREAALANDPDQWNEESDNPNERSK